MKKDFFKTLKQYFLNEHQDELSKFIPYYETLVQHEKELLALIIDFQEWDVHIQHDEHDHDGYTNGTLEFLLERGEHPSLESPNYHYEIELLRDDRYWGYCDCEPTDEGYNKEHECCGRGCDWVAPSFRLKKIVSEGYGSFNGQECDMWELEGKWENYLKVYKDEKKRQRMEYIEEQMERLKKEKESLMDEK